MSEDEKIQKVETVQRVEVEKHEPPHLSMLKNAGTVEEKAIALFFFVYDKILEKVGDVQESDREADVEITKKEMHIELFKWVFTRVLAVAFVVTVMVSIATLWKSGDKDMAKYMVTALAGVLTGWGLKSSFSDKPKP